MIITARAPPARNAATSTSPGSRPSERSRAVHGSIMMLATPPRAPGCSPPDSSRVSAPVHRRALVVWGAGPSLPVAVDLPVQLVDGDLAIERRVRGQDTLGAASSMTPLCQPHRLAKPHQP